MRHGTLLDLLGDADSDAVVSATFEGFEQFSEAYDAASSVIRTPAALERLIVEVLEDAQADGAVWVEPTIYLDGFNDTIGPGELVLEIATDALRRASEKTGVGAALIVSADRNRGPGDAIRQARLAGRAKNGTVRAFGLVNDELQYASEVFSEARRIARRVGLAFTPHAGEFGGPELVAWALESGADRIQHGIAAAKDADLMARLADRGVCLDVCPTSNVVLGAVASFQDHPLPVLLAAGVAVSLGADDPLFFSCSILSEYELARSQFGLTDHELASIAQASVRHSTAPPEVKRRAISGIRSWLAPHDESKA